MLQLVLFNVTNGLIIGAFYVLMALGLSLIINLSNVINFAHGNFLALGGYIAFVLTPFIGFWGALLVSPFLTAIFGYVIEKLLIRHVYARNHIYSLLLTFGLAFILQDVCRYIWGPNALPLDIPDILSQPLTPDLFFITWYRVFMVAVVIVAVAGLFAFLRYTRVGMRIRAGTLDLDTVSALGVNVAALRSFNFAVGSFLAGLAGVLAAGQIGLNPNMGDDLLMPSFIAIIVGGVGSLTGTLLGGLLIGVAAALTTVVYPAGHRGGDLRHHGDRAADPAARPARRGGDADMSTVTTRADAHRRPALAAARRSSGRCCSPCRSGCRCSAATPRSPAACWCSALAAMSLNLLLGFTGVLSFGHAAYFGLGAYGAGLTLKYVAASTPLAMLAGTLLGGIAGTLFGLLLVRRRGVYFAMVTIAFGQVCFYIAYKWDDFTGGYDGLRGFSARRSTSACSRSTSPDNGTLFYYFVLFVFGLAVGLQALILRSPFGRTLLAIRENERRARFLGIPVERHIWLSFSISCFFTALAGSALCAAQQLRRSARPPLRDVGQHRDDHGDGRHAHLLGAAGRRRAVRRCCRTTSRR